MKVRTLVVTGIVWAASLVGVGLWAQGSQGGGLTVRPAPPQTGRPIGPIITGENIGFQQVAGPPDRPGQVTGNLLVRINGEWLEVVSPPRVVR